MPGFATERSAKWNATGGSFRLRVRLTENLLGDPSPVNDAVIKNASRFTRFIDAHAPPSEVEAALNETLYQMSTSMLLCGNPKTRQKSNTPTRTTGRSTACLCWVPGRSHYSKADDSDCWTFGDEELRRYDAVERAVWRSGRDAYATRQRYEATFHCVMRVV